MKTLTSAKIILDSISPAGARITTMQLVYPRFIHAEAKTHRAINIGDDAYELLQETGFMDCKDLSRNASSSRAIPITKMIEQVRNDPAMPIHWGSNQPGMQAGAEIQHVGAAKDQWIRAASAAASTAEEMMELGLHKQVVNRILEPFQWMHTIVTATAWGNFFKLRLHPAADPNIHELARVMKEAMDGSVPTERDFHAPYVSQVLQDFTETEAMVSAARCARVSYLNHDGSKPDFDKDMALALTLKASGHASPFEHVAIADVDDSAQWANFRGWESYRNLEGI